MVERNPFRKDPIGEHYSDKGGHKARGDYWGRRGRVGQNFVPPEGWWLIKRTMFRDPRSGR